MLSNQQDQSLLYDLSSFYREFLPENSNLIKLFDVYAQTINYVWNVFGEASDSRFISTTRTLTNTPYFKVSIDSAVYGQDVAQSISALSLDNQVSYLDKNKFYTDFIFTMKDNSGDPQIYGMRIFDDFNGIAPLRMYEDYFIRSNRLYLLPKYIQNRKKIVHYLHAFDIKTNEYTLEKNFGTQFGINAGTLLPRYEYRDVLEAFIRAFRGQMTIKALRDSVLLATKWETFAVEDFKSPTISASKLQLYKDWIISPQKFIVSLPESLIPDKIKTNILRVLLDEVKDVATDYMIFYDIERDDPNSFPMIRKPYMNYQKRDYGEQDDTFNVSQVSYVIQENPLEVFGKYDSNFLYNYNLEYDIPPGNEVIFLDQYFGIQDQHGSDDSAVVNHWDKIRIPRNFRAIKDSTTNAINFTFDPNQDTTTSFELHASENQEGPFTQIETLNNNSAAASLNFAFNAEGSGNVYYKCMATDGQYYSMFTMPLTIIGLGEYTVYGYDDAASLDDTYSLDDAYSFDMNGECRDAFSYILDVPVVTILTTDSSLTNVVYGYDDTASIDDTTSLDDAYTFDDTLESVDEMSYIIDVPVVQFLM